MKKKSSQVWKLIFQVFWGKKVLEDEVRDAASSSQENYSLCEKLEICPTAEVDNHSEGDEKD